MSEICGPSQCGQYPASLFKSVNELQGVDPKSKSEQQSLRLAEDTVTLSADAIEMAKAELKGSAQANNVSFQRIQQTPEGLEIFNQSAKTRFYTQA